MPIYGNGQRAGASSVERHAADFAADVAHALCLNDAYLRAAAEIPPLTDLMLASICMMARHDACCVISRALSIRRKRARAILRDQRR